MNAAPLTIDLFCHVVDNFGDIGVCWRFARQMAHEKACNVRLFVDDLGCFAKIAPQIDPALPRQDVAGITIIHWSDGKTLRGMPPGYAVPVGSPGGLPIGDVVIEAFACTLPDALIDAMKARRATPYGAPVWIDLEYLSAEDWVEGCHAVVSPHPATGLDKTLFFPGFTAQTGGLIREGHLLRDRDAFQASEDVQNKWRAQWGLPPLMPGVLDISLFCYPQAPVADLFAALAVRPARLFIPEGFTQDRSLPFQSMESGLLSIYTYPFLPQEDYDRLLWTCGMNFVRGEDSFVRALWAGRPYIWQIYPQAENAHFVKLEAFLSHYTASWPKRYADSLGGMTRAWNLEIQKVDTISHFLDDLPVLANMVRARTATQAQQNDLATQLLHFIECRKRAC